MAQESILGLRGEKYIGQWQNDEREGQGMYIYSDGEIEMGESKNNQLIK